MLVSESDAQSMICCGPASAGRVLIPADEDRRHSVQRMCVASACMAWRWTLKTNDNIGYCGLAGEPEDDGA